MVSILGKLDDLKNSVRSGTFSRLLAVLLGGTLNQRGFAVIGIVLTLVSIYWMILDMMVPLLMAALGGVLAWLAIRDYERTLGKKS